MADLKESFLLIGCASKQFGSFLVCSSAAISEGNNLCAHQETRFGMKIETFPGILDLGTSSSRLSIHTASCIENKACLEREGDGWGGCGWGRMTANAACYLQAQEE